MKFIFAVTDTRGGQSSVCKDLPGLDAAKTEAENLLAPSGVSAVEVFQRVENGRISKQITSAWSS